MTTTTATVTKNYTHHKFFGSSVLSEAFYSSETGDLFVILNSGARLGYKDVPQYIWDYFVEANSAGRFWNAYIKGGYEGQSGDVTLLQFAARVAQAASTDVTVTIEVNGRVTLTGKTDKTLHFNDGTLQDFINGFGLEFPDGYKVKEVRHQFNN